MLGMVVVAAIMPTTGMILERLFRMMMLVLVLVMVVMLIVVHLQLAHD